VVARSFARIFYRNAINIGLPIVECASEMGLKDGDKIQIDFEKGEIRNLQTAGTYQSTQFPEFMKELIQSGGLMEWIKKRGLV